MLALRLFLALISLLILGPVVEAQTSDSLWTSFFPLMVRSPHMNVWMNGTTGRRPPTDWPIFYKGHIFGWTGHIRVDGVTWKWMGAAGAPGGMNLTNLTDVHITPTQTILKITTGSVDLTVTYLSPIEPSDPVKQSLPLAYVSLQATSADGQPHSVQVYSDISGEWLSPQVTRDHMTWSLKDTGVMIYHELKLSPSLPFVEADDHAQDLTVYHAMLSRSGMTYMIDSDINCRTRFAQNATLTNGATSDSPRIINDNGYWTVFAIAVDLGIIEAGSTSDEVVWGIGMLRDPAISYQGPDGQVTSRSPYWRTQFSTMPAAVQAGMQDYTAAKARANALDATILQNATAISSQYATLVSLAARQAIAGTELTVGTKSGATNQFDLSDVKMFMKDIGDTHSNDRQVNSVTGLYASFPFFLSLNASYGGYLLEPVLEYAASNNWPFDYPPEDLGKHYPNATAGNVAHAAGVEHSGNMLIMTLAHARASGDGSLISKYYSTLKTWADYLVNNTSPVPSSQENADGLTVANSTNLALKGIIGIRAMAEISSLMKQNGDVQTYSSKAAAGVSTWQSLALSSDRQHVLSNYGVSDQSWALMYNMYADKLLGTGLVDQSLYEAETRFIKNSLIGSYPYGLPIDDSDLQGQGNTAWTLFTAASVTDTAVRDALIAPIWRHASQNLSGTTLPYTYHLDAGGGAIFSQASPFVGGIFAPMALNVPNKTVEISSPVQTEGSSKKKSNVGPIVGGVIAAVAGAAIIAIGAFFWWRKSRQDQYSTAEKTVDIAHGEPEPFPYESTPFHPEGFDRRDLSQVDVAQAPAGTQQPQAPRVLSAKALEHLNQTAQYEGTSAGPSSYTTSSAPTSSQEPSTTVVGSPQESALSSQEIQGLRTEVENLRRVMQSIQVQGLEPPPTYEHTTQLP